MALSLVVPVLGLGASQVLADNVTRQCEEEAAAAGLGDYPDLVRQYVIECVEQYQPGSRDNLESSYRTPEPEPAPAAEPVSEPAAETAEPPPQDAETSEAPRPAE
ncbi:MAG: hypothetical protein AMJ69_02105 [Gammaproteobacteria bacterium SG8_47]|nr:MAG: hypothetical protein AMJ69_02105 [Gammaproteobacteria bacterium SG8_47]